jgi:ADP-heptose:LPS heptosyltransferase
MTAAPARIVLFRALQLGDMLCAVPALRALRAAHPRARITLIGLPWAQAFVERFPGLIDELLVFPGAVGFPEQTETNAGLPRFFAEAAARRFDLAIQMHGSGGIANDILFNLGAHRQAGFVQPGESRPGSFIPWPDSLPEPDRYLALMQALGSDAVDRSLWLPLNDDDRAEASAVLRAHRAADAAFALIHPGAQLPSRRWPSARFAAVADALSDTGLKVLITGTRGEAALADALVDAMKRPAFSVAGRTTLGGMAALVERARLLVCNDTSVSHIAAAMRTPSVVIASGSDTRRWAPANPTLHRVLADYPACRPCAYAQCPYGHECALAISVEQVIDAAHAQLNPAEPRPASIGAARAKELHAAIG